MTRAPRGRAKPGRGPAAAGVRHDGGDGERLQKLLSAAGVASRRQIEAWVKAGRIQVNGKPAEPGQRVSGRDVILIDGRRIRLEAKAKVDRRVLLYHRPPGEPLNPAAAGEAVEGEAPVASSYEHLPPVRGHRWLPLSPLAPIDTGLEVFTTDGVLRAAAGKLAHEIQSTYAVRLRGDDPSAEFLASLPAAAEASDPPFTILAVEQGGGEGRNFWLNLDVKRARGRDLRTLFATQGFEVSRVMRTHYGPLGMDRALARGRHQELEDEQRAALYDAFGLGEPKPVKAMPAPPGVGHGPRPSRPPRRKPER